MDCEALNREFASKSFVSGHKLSHDDFDLRERLPPAINPTRWPHLARWADLVSSSSRPLTKAKAKGQDQKQENDDNNGDDDAIEVTDVRSLQCHLLRSVRAFMCDGRQAFLAKSASDLGLTLEDLARMALEEEAKEKAESGSRDRDDDLSFLGDSDDDEETQALMRLDVKPIDSSVDMRKLEAAVRALDFSGVHWLGSALIDVAYGLKKLRITAQLTDVLVPGGPDAIREAIELALPEQVSSTYVFSFFMA
jgi:translation elongation factor EF-1beta